MCGILAAINTNVSKDGFVKALRLMEHRGPDNMGTFFDGRNLFGHTRLSILDLNERSNQPFFFKDYMIIYNGEVYNYKELRKEHNLETETTSDTEVVLKMFIKYGEKALDYFNGMFAFLIYNTKTKEVFVARDRLGIKPLYYRQINGGIIFSSEIAPVLSLFDDRISPFAMRQYKKLRMTVRNHTLYEHIFYFPAGYYFKDGEFRQYWELDYSPKEPPTDDELRWLIEDAVQLRKRSDVPVGSYLSGGLDSTVLTYLLRPDHTWTVGFKEMNEFEWGRLAAKNLTSVHHEVLVDKDQFLKTTEWMVRKRKEPLSVPNEVLLYLMTKEVKKENTVVLSGEGADELFWGYDRIFRWAHQAKELTIEGFDRYYCYGSERDDEVIAFALENVPEGTVEQKVGYYFQTVHLHGLLRRVDNSTMFNSVEARVPFVDHRLVERLAGVPFEWKMGSSFKEPLKRLFRELIPKEIIERKKVGFPVPLEQIFMELKDGQRPYDAWFDYNLKLLKTEVENV